MHCCAIVLHELRDISEYGDFSGSDRKEKIFAAAGMYLARGNFGVYFFMKGFVRPSRVSHSG